MAKYEPGFWTDEQFGIAVRARMEETGFRQKFLKKNLAAPMGLSESTAVDVIRNIENGHISGSISNNPEDIEKRLEEVAKVLHALNFSVGDCVVASIRERYSNFKYPPEDGISYARLREKHEAMEKNRIVVEKKDISHQKVRWESLDQKVRHFLDLPVTNKPDDYFKSNAQVARLARLVGYEPNYDLELSRRAGITIEVTEIYTNHTLKFNASYPKSRSSDKQLQGLVQFIESLKGQTVSIVYTINSWYARNSKILQWVAPLEGGQVYVRGLKPQEGLVPYTLKPNALGI